MNAICRVALALWGRRTYSALALATAAVLAITSLASSLSFYWIGLLLFLQRGPLPPCYEELSEPGEEGSAEVTSGLALLGLPLLVLAPYPLELVLAFDQLGSASF